MSSFDDVLAGNQQYASTFQDGGEPAPAAKGLAVVTCMDSRLDPLRMLGLERGDAKIMRNAGARVIDDVLRNLVLGHVLLGVQRVMVLAHTTCAMTGTTEDQVQDVLRDRAGLDARSLHFEVMEDQLAAMGRDVQRVRSWPFLPGLPVTGCLYDLKTGRIEVVHPDDQPVSG